MKTLIIGMQGSGVTTFIKNKIIPALPNIDELIITDFCNEFTEYSKSSKRIPMDHLTMPLRKSVILANIIQAHNKTTFIIPDHQTFLDPAKDDTRRYSHQWLYNALIDTKSILNFRSIKQCGLLNYNAPKDEYKVDKIYLFDTLDGKETRENFIDFYSNRIELIPQFVR